VCTVGLKWEEEVGDKVDCEADKEEEEKMDWGCAGGPGDGVTEVGRAGTDLWKALILFYNLETTQ